MIRLFNLINARSVIANYATQKTSVRLAYKLMKFLKASSEEDAFYNERRRAIILECCQKDEKGNPVQNQGGILLQPDKIEECSKLMNELDATEVDEPSIKFTLTELEEYQMSASDLFALDEFIEEE